MLHVAGFVSAWTISMYGRSLSVKSFMVASFSCGGVRVSSQSDYETLWKCSCSAQFQTEGERLPKVYRAKSRFFGGM